MKRHINSVISVIIATIMIIISIPFGVVAADGSENETPNKYNISVSEKSPEYIKEIAEKSQLFDEFEVISLREENVKHYALSDGTLKAVVYPYSVHEKCEDGTWIEKDNVQYLLNRRIEDNDGISEANGNRSYYQISDNVIGDTYVNSSSPSTNYSNSSQLYVGSSTKRAYISLPTPSLPSNATINGSELDIMYYFYPSITSGYVTVGVYEVTSPWSVSTLNWNAVQYGGSGAIGSNAIVTRNLHTSNYISQSSPGQDTLDITSAVQDWYAGVSNYGIALEYTGGASTSAVIYSLESGYYPLYTIYYSLDSLPVENGTYMMYNIKLGRYLQFDPNGSDSNQAEMELWSLDSSPRQKWVFTYLHNGYYKITSTSSGYSLAIKSGYDNTNGARVIQETYSANPRQQWGLSYSSRGNIVIRPKSSENYSTDWVMTAAAGIINGDGREVVQYAYSDNTDLKDEWEICLRDRAILTYLLEQYTIRNAYISSVKSYLENSSFGYASTVYTPTYSNVNEIKNGLQNTDIFIHHTHGEQTAIVVSTTPLSQTKLYMQDIQNLILSNLDLVILLTCKTAENYNISHINNNNPVNIVEQFVLCGAETVIGFSDDTSPYDCNDFIIDFMYEMTANGLTVSQAKTTVDTSNYVLGNFMNIMVIAGNQNKKIR